MTPSATAKWRSRTAGSWPYDLLTCWKWICMPAPGRRSTDVHFHGVVDDTHGKRRHAALGRRTEVRAGRQIEGRAVPRADQLRALHVAFGQRCPLVRASIFERVELLARVD